MEDITRRKLETDKKLMFMSGEEAHAELMDELERYVPYSWPPCPHLSLTAYTHRYPLIDRAMSDFQGLENDTFISNLRQSLGDLLAESRGEGSTSSSGGMRHYHLPSFPLHHHISPKLDLFVL